MMNELNGSISFRFSSFFLFFLCCLLFYYYYYYFCQQMIHVTTMWLSVSQSCERMSDWLEKQTRAMTNKLRQIFSMFHTIFIRASMWARVCVRMSLSYVNKWIYIIIFVIIRLLHMESVWFSSAYLVCSSPPSLIFNWITEFDLYMHRVYR